MLERGDKWWETSEFWTINLNISILELFQLDLCANKTNSLGAFDWSRVSGSEFSFNPKKKKNPSKTFYLFANLLIRLSRQSWLWSADPSNLFSTRANQTVNMTLFFFFLNTYLCRRREKQAVFCAAVWVSSISWPCFASLAFAVQSK